LRIVKFFRFVKILRLLRIAKLRVIVIKIIEYLRLSDVTIGMMGFFKLMINVLLLAHWVACIWHMIG